MKKAPPFWKSARGRLFWFSGKKKKTLIKSRTVSGTHVDGTAFSNNDMLKKGNPKTSVHVGVDVILL